MFSSKFCHQSQFLQAIGSGMNNINHAMIFAVDVDRFAFIYILKIDIGSSFLQAISILNKVERLDFQPAFF